MGQVLTTATTASQPLVKYLYPVTLKTALSVSSLTRLFCLPVSATSPARGGRTRLSSQAALTRLINPDTAGHYRWRRGDLSRAPCGC